MKFVCGKYGFLLVKKPGQLVKNRDNTVQRRGFNLTNIAYMFDFVFTVCLRAKRGSNCLIAHLVHGE
jgi:hypothetical protein